VTARRALLKTVAVLAAALLVGGARPAAAEGKQFPPLKKLHVLLVIDTNSNLGPAVAEDRKTIVSLITDTIPSDLRTLKIMEGNEVSPQNILAYYKNLNVGADEGIFFYYTGHGASDKRRGHVLTLSSAKDPFLFRSDLLTAMRAKNAGLTVVLTDCCSNVINITAPARVTVARAGATDLHPLMSNLFFEQRGVVDITAAELDTSAFCSPDRGSFFTLALRALIMEEEVPRDKKSGEADKPRYKTMKAGGFLTWQDFYPQLRDTTNKYFQDWKEQRQKEGHNVTEQKTQMPVAYSLADQGSLKGWKLGAQVRFQEGSGMVVQGVTANGPAAKLGLEKNDVIVAINDQPIKSNQQYAQLLDGSGGWVTITLIDNQTKKSFRVSVRLEPVQ
jgi:hypothetical protein